MRKRSTRPPSVESLMHAVYDPLDFIVSAKNEHDHSEELPRVQVSPALAAAVKGVVGRDDTEFGSIAAFQRWAFVLALEFLRRLHPDRPSNISIIRGMEAENAYSATRREFLESLEKTSDEAFRLQGKGLVDEAAKHIWRQLTRIRQLPKDDPWRQLLEDEIKKKHGHLLKRGRIVGHVPAPRAGILPGKRSAGGGGGGDDVGDDEVM